MGGGAADEQSTKVYRVLVTGFGANKNAPYGNSKSNPAGEIAHLLPAKLAGDNPLNVSGVDIELVTDLKEEWISIDVSHYAARRAIRELHEEYADKVDAWIHLGRTGADYYGCARRAFRQDFTASWGPPDSQEGYYRGPDNRKETARDIGPNPWTSVPLGLNTSFDLNNLVIDADRAYRKHYESVHGEGRAEPLPEIRSQVEAGSALCGFVYYESLAHSWNRGGKRWNLFVHVPREKDRGSLIRGRDAVLAVIGATIADMIRQASRPLGKMEIYQSGPES